MKATELMIGDFLQAQPNNKIVRIVEIKEDEIVCNERCYDLKPIPITRDIIRKIGFCPGQYSDFLSGINSGYRVEYLVSNGFTIKSTTSRLKINCDYVHELQHALKLCKIDKEIKL